MSIITDHTHVAIVNAPSESINMTEWLFTLKDQEYQACSKAHIGAGTSFTSDGKRMSINVENVGGTLLIQHYVEEINERHHCRVYSISDTFSPLANSKLAVTWEVKVRKIDEVKCEFSNRVIVSLTEDFILCIRKSDVPLDILKVTMAENVVAHNLEETPLFAKDIEAKALKGIWKPDRSTVKGS